MKIITLIFALLLSTQSIANLILGDWHGQLVVQGMKLRISFHIIKEGEQCWMVSLSQISLFEIMGNYTRVFFEDKQPLIYKSLNQIEENLPTDTFFRINRQQIINIKHITNVEA